MLPQIDWIVFLTNSGSYLF